MKKALFLIFLLFVIAIPAHAEDFTAPEPPDSAQELMPHTQSSFGADLWHILTTAFSALSPRITQCVKVCVSVFAVALLLSFLRSLQGISTSTVMLPGAVLVAFLLLTPTNALVADASETVADLSEYGKLLLPVLTAALAAQGGGGAATGLYTATALFDAVLGSLISKVLMPFLYVYLALAVVGTATGQDIIKNMKNTILGIAGKGLRTILYIFTGYLTVTGVVGGAADQMTVKAAKLTISGMVPVVGSIMADASETILISAGVVKGAVGIYGLLSVIAIGIGPFLRIGIQYLALKGLSAVCAVFVGKEITDLIDDFATAMGLLLAMTGTMCLLLLVSTVCFMKGTA